MRGGGGARPSAIRRGPPRIAQQYAAPARGRSTLTDPASKLALCGRETRFERRLRLSVDTGNVARIFCDVQFDHVAQQVPDVAAALEWWQRAVPGAIVLHADETWGLLEAGGAKLAFVVADQHPDHVAYKVSTTELERLAAVHGAAIASHRDGSRSFYVHAPGDHRVEVVAYPDVLDEDAE